MERIIPELPALTWQRPSETNQRYQSYSIDIHFPPSCESALIPPSKPTGNWKFYKLHTKVDMFFSFHFGLLWPTDLIMLAAGCLARLPNSVKSSWQLIEVKQGDKKHSKGHKNASRLHAPSSARVGLFSEVIDGGCVSYIYIYRYLDLLRVSGQFGQYSIIRLVI